MTPARSLVSLLVLTPFVFACQTTNPAPSPSCTEIAPRSEATTEEGDDGTMGDASAQWPDADQLFRRDPAWRGGDGALSIDLGGDRILWLFGDSFVAKDASATSRRDCTMVRNSVGIQSGRDPSTASMAFAHVRDGSGPRSFFLEDGQQWFWPNHGVKLDDDAVYVFLARVESTSGDGLGFASAGWEITRLRGIEGPPETWSLERLGSLTTSFATVVGAAVVRVDGYVVATAVDEPGDHSVRLVRWAERDLELGLLDRAEWWDGGAWVPSESRARPPAVVASEVSTEMSLSRDGKTGDWLLVHSRGFGASDIVVRRAARLEGPYDEPATLCRPAESDRARPFVYAGKAHPEVLGADLIVTYASNSFDFD